MWIDRRWAATTALAAGVLAAPAAEAAQFDIAPGTLGAVVAAIGARAGITIIVTDPDVAARRSPGVHGNLSVRAAIAHVLRGTGAEAIFYDNVTVRIVRKKASASRPPRPVASSREPDTAPSSTIIVSASKQRMAESTYPGSIHIMEPEDQWSARNASRGSAAFTQLTPALSSTNLGRGRNKLYVRGIADSSFNGQTQSTVGQYLGDARLNYNAPDPDLNLFDLKRIEVLAGPQGTLYGAGSLGGVVRLVPNPPDPDATYGSLSTGISATRSGGIGGDEAAMFNLPISYRTAIRGVIYGTRDAGYIDDPTRGLRNVNKDRSAGGRFSLRREELGDWTLDVGAVVQNIDSDDSQYTVRGQPPLSRRSALAQPARNDYHLIYLVGRRETGNQELLTATSFVHHELEAAYDATGADGTSTPRLFSELNRFTFLAHETRLAGGSSRAPWVVGFSGIYNLSTISRSLGAPDAPQGLPGVRNIRFEASLFGQKSVPISPSLTASGGGRLTVARNLGRLLNETSGARKQSSETRAHFAGDAALSWKPTPRLLIYSHYQQGFRPGGFAASADGSTAGGTEFAADDLTQIEFGLRWRDIQEDAFSVRAALFRVDWEQVQADIIDAAGLTNTANIGNGRIEGFDGEIQWRISPDLTFSASAFQNQSYLYNAAPGFSSSGRVTLPNVPRDGIRSSLEWRRETRSGVMFSGNASLRYVGKSFLGPAPTLDIPQGKYFTGDIGLRLDFARFGVSLDIRNVGNTRGNTFSFGNPFGVSARDQLTPLRPRTVRLGFDMRF